MPKINAIAIGGRHQFFHFLPVAFEIAARDTDVEIFVATDDDARFVRKLADRLGYAPPCTSIMAPTCYDRIVERLMPRRRINKVSRILKAASKLRDADAILCAERTSSLLKRLPGYCPAMIHFRHGAGDRAVGFEKRISRFDHVLTVGEKDRQRTIAEGLLPPERCHVGGAIKVASIALMHSPAPLFDNDRPVILFNPHFDSTYGSFDLMAGLLIDGVLADGRYNLVVAPHMRLVERWPSDAIARWEARSVPGRVIVDMGSQRSMDMSYTLGAGLYVGDVSSQVYEFILRPRPCLFVDTHKADWRADPDYAMWHFGPVIGPEEDIMGAIDNAFATFDNFRPVQKERANMAFGAMTLDGTEAETQEHAHLAIANAANLVLELVATNGVPA